MHFKAIKCYIPNGAFKKKVNIISLKCQFRHMKKKLNNNHILGEK